MYKNMIAVTNRHLCHTDFLEQIEVLASTELEAIILREKDLSQKEYMCLAKEVLAICRKHNKKCILHSFVQVARELDCPTIHLPLSLLLQHADNGKTELDYFTEIGTSVHSTEDALLACRLGATYLTAGHIFETDCKKGLPGRGLTFLKNVCDSVSVPVYGIGGITPENLGQVMETGATGGCMMSLAMKK
jgi:thiamine-phosphate pyrophosphorylase